MADPPPAPGDATALCLACGLCCDGSIFDVAILRPDEVAAAAATGLTTGMEEGRDCFALPCPAFAGRCTRFDDRPAVCGEFRCKLLRRLDRGEVALGEALAIVEEGQRLRDAADSAGRAGENRTDARKRWKILFRDGNPGETPRWYLAMTAFNLWIDRHFRQSNLRMTAEE